MSQAEQRLRRRIRSAFHLDYCPWAAHLSQLAEEEVLDLIRTCSKVPRQQRERFYRDRESGLLKLLREARNRKVVKEVNWRERFEQIKWDHFYILDADNFGVKKAKEEKRVVPAGDNFKTYMMELCLQVEREARDGKEKETQS